MQNLKTRKLNRLKDYDYSTNGYYFVTVCSKNREIIFGEYVENPVGTALAAVHYKNNIKLSKLGQIIENQWINMPNQYDNVQLDKYTIMPNHIHGILIINKRTGASPVPTISNIIGSFKSKTYNDLIERIFSSRFAVSQNRSFWMLCLKN